MPTGDRAEGRPFLVSQDLSFARGPEPVSLEERKYDEAWLQELIERHPEILPVVEIDEAYAPAYCIGREVPTAVGPADHILASPTGRLTIVETKLWKNPEARREAVIQLIDYAKEVRKWTYEELDRQVRSYTKRTGGKGKDLFEAVSAEAELDEADFVDAVSRNLRRGAFLLLVVGDGIRESVEEMAEVLSQTPQMLFTLALVELKVYKAQAHPDLPRLVMPRVVMRTREVVRAVVRVEGTGEARVQVDMEPEPGPSGVARPRRTLSETEYFDELGRRTSPDEVAIARRIYTDLQERGAEIDWRSSSFVAKLPDPGGSGKRITLLVVYRDGTVTTGWGVQQLEALGYDTTPPPQFVRAVAALFPHVKPAGSSKGAEDTWRPNLALSELDTRYAELMVLVDDYIAALRRVAAAGEA